MNDDIYLLAFAWRALGEVYEAQARQGDATRALDQSLALFQRLNISEEIRQTGEMLAAWQQKQQAQQPA
jgi:hypothetical protein